MARGKLQLVHSTWSWWQTSILQSQHSMKTVHVVFLISFTKYTNSKSIKTNWTKATCKQFWVKYHSYLQHWILWNLPYSDIVYISTAFLCSCNPSLHLSKSACWRQPFLKNDSRKTRRGIYHDIDVLQSENPRTRSLSSNQWPCANAFTELGTTTQIWLNTQNGVTTTI